MTSLTIYDIDGPQTGYVYKVKLKDKRTRIQIVMKTESGTKFRNINYDSKEYANFLDSVGLDNKQLTIDNLNDLVGKDIIWG